MREVPIKIYKLEELEDKAKAIVINRFQEMSGGNLIDTLKDELEYHLDENKVESLNTPNIYYSLSCSQGDGVCFTGKFRYKGVDFNITHRGRYSHWKSLVLEFEDNPYEAEFHEIVRDICISIERTGYAEIEYESSEKYIKELCEINEYEFLKDGTMYHGSN